MDQRELIARVLAANNLTVIATVNKDNKPEDAVIAFAENEKFEIIFGTYNFSRKYINIQTNPNIAMAIGWSSMETVQYEGTAQELTPGEELEEAKRVLKTKNPSSERFESHPEQRYFKVTPTWIRYSNFEAEGEPHIFELTNFS